MKSDLTCPVEVVAVAIQEGTAPVQETNGDTNESGQIICLIDFYNLSDRIIDSIQMNIVCFDAKDQRLGGRLVRSAARGEAKARFSGAFMPEHVENVARVEASVEKVWFLDGVIWRREERNVREYTPNALPEGRELDRLRSVAGPDAAGYAREEERVWMCVCGRANKSDDEHCVRCQRERDYVLKNYSFAVIDATLGRKERMLEQKTRDTLRRSSEETVEVQRAVQRRQKKRRRRLWLVILLLVLAALILAGARWGAPYALSAYAGKKLEQGLSADAKELYNFVAENWPDEFGASAGARLAEERIIDGLMDVNTEITLSEAVKRSKNIGDAQRLSRATMARAQLLVDDGRPDEAEAILRGLPEDEAAQAMLHQLVYNIAMEAKKKTDYPAAAERFESLGAYEDAEAQRDECIYLYGRQLMREGKYQEACDQFMLVTGEQDAIALIRQCRYALAQEHQRAGRYVEAAQLYESLGVYEEAEMLGRFCRYTAGMSALEKGELDEAAEQLKLAEDYEDAPERFMDVAFTLGSAALEKGDNQAAIGWLEQLPQTEDVASALNRAVYAYASQLEKEGQMEAAATEFASLGSYEDARDRANQLQYDLAVGVKDTRPMEALGRFEALGDYKDAYEQAVSCRFQIAQDAMDAGEYEKALPLFEELGDARDARDQAQRCRYALAQKAMEDGEYEKAAELYEACGAYLDAEDGVLRARYQQAAALYDQGKYEEAAKAFDSLGSYEDAKQRTRDSEDAWLGDAYLSAGLDMDVGDFASVIETLEPYANADLPERYEDLDDLYEQACLSRAQELTGTNRPLDALPVLERIKDNPSAKKRLDAYVYQIIGRWKDTHGVEYIFRRDGSCCIGGQEGYFGGSGYEIHVGPEPYPTSGGFKVVSLRNKTLTLRRLENDKTVRLNYLGGPEEE